MKALMITFNVYENNLQAAISLYADVGIEVQCATHASEAWEMINSNRYHLFIVEKQGLKFMTDLTLNACLRQS